MGDRLFGKEGAGKAVPAGAPLYFIYKTSRAAFTFYVYLRKQPFLTIIFSVHISDSQV